MKTEPLFNIDRPFPNPKEVKPIKDTEKLSFSGSSFSFLYSCQSGFKNSQNNKPKKNLSHDPFGKLGNKIDIIV